MKFSIKTFATVAACAALSLTITSAVETDPVGYVTTTIPDGDDALFGITLTQSPVSQGEAANVSGASFDVSTTLVADELNNTHYVLATSGSNAGQWSEVVDNDVSSVTTADSILANGDGFSVIPFWTLATLLPEGGGVGASADPFNPSATVLTNDIDGVGINLSPDASYFYYAGPTPAAGWYSTSFAPSDDVVLSPETYIIVRNNSGSEISVVNAGAVPVTPVGSQIVGLTANSQDNQITNPYPAPLTLSSSGLTDVVAPAADPFNPTDTVLIFDNDDSGQNISPAASYFYYAGPTPTAGWYSTSFAPSDNVEIPSGGALIVRKGAGDNELTVWAPPVPYID